MSASADERTGAALRRVTEVFVELADVLTEGFDVVRHLGVLVGRCVELLPVTAAATLLADHDGRLRPASASDEPAWRVALWHARCAEGPGLECSRSGSGIVNATLDPVATRWPDFVARARAHGYVRVHAIPMRHRTATEGVLVLFSATPEILGEAELGLGQAMADVAAVGIAQRRAMARGAEATARLREALGSRTLIEQAKGVLAERLQLPMDDAFALLRDYARRSDRTLPAVARGIVEGRDGRPGIAGRAAASPR